MEINAGLIITTFVFLALYMIADRVAAILINKSRDQAEVKKKEFDTQAFDKLGDKLVATMQAMHGGAAGEAIRAMKGVIIEPDDGRQESGRVQYQPPRENGAHRGSDFPAPRAAETASR